MYTTTESFSNTRDIVQYPQLSGAGALCLLRIWVERYFIRDFWKFKVESSAVGASSPRRRRTQFGRLRAFLISYGRRRPAPPPDILHELNRVKLAILRKYHEHIVRGSNRQRLAEISLGTGSATGRPGGGQMMRAHLSDFAPQMIAEQLTLLEFSIFRHIDPEEFSDKGWTRGEKRAPNLIALVQRSDRLSNWVASNVLVQTSVHAQVRVLGRFITIAQWLELLGNYNSLMGVLGGLQMHAMSRLRSVWAPKPKYRAVLAHLEQLMSANNNYATYRRALAKRAHDGEPTLPYLGVILRDLTFIEDGNGDFVDAAGKEINAAKLEMLGAALRRIHDFQTRADYAGGKIKGKITPLLQHLAALPAMKTEEIEARSEAIKPRRTADGSSSDFTTAYSSDDSAASVSGAAGDSSADNSSDASDVVDLMGSHSEMSQTGATATLLSNYLQ